MTYNIFLFMTHINICYIEIKHNKHMQKHSKHQVEMPGLYPGLAREAVERRQQRLSMGIQVGMARKLVSHW